MRTTTCDFCGKKVEWPDGTIVENTINSISNLGTSKWDFHVDCFYKVTDFIRKSRNMRKEKIQEKDAS